MLVICQFNRSLSVNLVRSLVFLKCLVSKTRRCRRKKNVEKVRKNISVFVHERIIFCVFFLLYLCRYQGLVKDEEWYEMCDICRQCECPSACVRVYKCVYWICRRAVWTRYISMKAMECKCEEKKAKMIKHVKKICLKRICVRKRKVGMGNQKRTKLVK